MQWRLEPCLAHVSAEHVRLVIWRDELLIDGGNARLGIRDIEAIEFGVPWACFNPSVLVCYRDGDTTQEAYFADSRAYDYAGFLGGTRRLADSIGHSEGVRSETGRADANKMQWLA